MIYEIRANAQNVEKKIAIKTKAMMSLRGSAGAFRGAGTVERTIMANAIKKAAKTKGRTAMCSLATFIAIMLAISAQAKAINPRVPQYGRDKIKLPVFGAERHSTALNRCPEKFRTSN